MDYTVSILIYAHVAGGTLSCFRRRTGEMNIRRSWHRAWFGSAVAVSGVGQDKTPQSLVTPAFAGLFTIVESGIKADLTTGMTTDRKIFDFPLRRGIMAEIEYPGIAKLVSRLVWDQETVRSSRTTRTKIPLKSLISEGFFLFFVYCDTEFEDLVLILKRNK